MDLKNFHFLSTKKQQAKNPRILKYKDTFFSATFLLCVFEAAFFFPCFFQLTYYFICSYQQLHLHRWEAHTVTFTPCNYLPSRAVSELNQMMLILKASKIALLAAFELLPCFKKNCLQKCLQLSLTVLSFKNKSLWIKRDHFLVLLVFVVTHSLLGRLGEGNARCGGGWDDMLVCRERDDTDLEKERSAVTMYSISCASLRHGVCAEWKLQKLISCNEKNGKLHTPTQSYPPPSRVQGLVNRRFMPIFTNHRKMFWQLWHTEHSCSVMDKAEWMVAVLRTQRDRVCVLLKSWGAQQNLYLLTGMPFTLTGCKGN